MLIVLAIVLLVVYLFWRFVWIYKPAHRITYQQGGSTSITTMYSDYDRDMELEAIAKRNGKVISVERIRVRK